MLLPGPDSFDGQFVLSTAARPCPHGWRQWQLGSVFMSLAPTIPTVPVVDADDRPIGLLLGMPIDLEREVIVEEKYRVDCKLEEVRDLDNFVEKNIYRMTGSFVFVLSLPESKRIYLDANGTLSVVFDPLARVAGATASVLLDAAEYAKRFRADLYRILDVDDAGWFPAGLTAHAGIDRLLCNHYLDLDTWTVRRHWPVLPIEPSPDPVVSCARICHRISRTIEILARRRSTGVALTAGNDSRLLLACSRHLLANLSFVTVAAPAALLDVTCAKRLARQLGLQHQVLPYREATVAEQDLWRFRAGHCVGGNNVKMHPSVRPLDGRHFIGGLGGEVGRGFLWLNAQQHTVIDAQGLVARLKLPRAPDVLQAVEAWLSPIAHFDTLLVLDLAYLELRMSAWGFCDSYVKPKQLEIHPMISRANYMDMLSLPPEARRKGDIYFQAIETLWKEASKVPINKYGNYKDVLRPAKEAIRHPKRASRKVLQVFAAWRSRTSERFPV